MKQDLILYLLLVALALAAALVAWLAFIAFTDKQAFKKREHEQH